MTVVAKFGGSSVKDATAMKRCAAIVASRPEIKVVIISATYQTTNHLEEMARYALTGEWDTCLARIEQMQERHLTLASDLLCHLETREMVKKLCAETRELCQVVSSGKVLTDALMDQIYSIGERLSSTLFCDHLTTLLKEQRPVAFKDARSVLKTSNHFKRAEPLLPETKKAVHELWRSELADQSLIVTQGFIGSTLDGETTTLGREGSDYSAALFGEAIGAKLVQIWTDVCGIATGDPRHVDGAIFLHSLSYEEATLMAENGAKVLFERTLAPAERSGTQVFVGSSLEPSAKGTLIGAMTDIKAGPKGVAYDPVKKTLTVVGHSIHLDQVFMGELIKVGGQWKTLNHQIQRDEASYDDFKIAHSVLLKWLK